MTLPIPSNAESVSGENWLVVRFNRNDHNHSEHIWLKCRVAVQYDDDAKTKTRALTLVIGCVERHNPLHDVGL